MQFVKFETISNMEKVCELRQYLKELHRKHRNHHIQLSKIRIHPLYPNPCDCQQSESLPKSDNGETCSNSCGCNLNDLEETDNFTPCPDLFECNDSDCGLQKDFHPSCPNPLQCDDFNCVEENNSYPSCPNPRGCSDSECAELYTIWTWLPARFAVCQPELLYTSEEHGTSLMTLYTRIESYQPTLIFIKTTNDEVFGAFCSTYWRERRQSSKKLCYFGTGETFIFTLCPQKKKYEWVGLHEDDIPNTANMFLAGDNSILTIGGGHGEAIQLDANLLHCRTQHCDTFDNDPLCSDQDFTCKVVEVYGFH